MVFGGASLATVLAAGVFAPRVNTQEADQPKQVLVLHSTRLDEQFAVATGRELPKLLAEGLGEPVDYYAEYFDFPRFPQPEYESAYVDFLRLKYTGQRFDLLIVMGEVAINFLSRYRDVLFDGTPAVFFSHNPPRSPLSNSTGLINPLHFSRSIDLALALQPDLKHVYVVSGVNAVDQSLRETGENGVPSPSRDGLNSRISRAWRRRTSSSDWEHCPHTRLCTTWS